MPAPAKNEQQRRQQHAAIQRFDLLLDLLLPRRQRHCEDAVFERRGRQRYGGDQIGIQRADAFAHDGGRFATELERLVHFGRRARRQESGGEEIALAGGDQAAGGEEIHVLIDQPADPHHQVVFDRNAVLGGLRHHEILDDTTGGVGRANRLLLDVRPHPIGDVHARHNRQRHNRHKHRRDECDEQLAIEARANLSQQRGRPDAAAAGPHEEAVRATQQQARQRREHGELGEVHQVVERSRRPGSRARRCRRGRSSGRRQTGRIPAAARPRWIDASAPRG